MGRAAQEEVGWEAVERILGSEAREEGLLPSGTSHGVAHWTGGWVECLRLTLRD